MCSIERDVVICEVRPITLIVVAFRFFARIAELVPFRFVRRRKEVCVGDVEVAEGVL